MRTYALIDFIESYFFYSCRSLLTKKKNYYNNCVKNFVNYHCSFIYDNILLQLHIKM